MPIPIPVSEGLYLRCIECNHLTPVNEGVTPNNKPCERCDAEGEDDPYNDPYCTELVRVTACPKAEKCTAENHHYGLGQHMTYIDYQ